MVVFLSFAASAADQSDHNLKSALAIGNGEKKLILTVDENLVAVGDDVDFTAMLMPKEKDKTIIFKRLDTNVEIGRDDTDGQGKAERPDFSQNQPIIIKFQAETTDGLKSNTVTVEWVDCAIRATVPSTPCLSPRSPRKGKAVAAREFVSKENGKTFDAGKSLVLIEGSANAVELEGIGEFAKSAWVVRRDTQTAANPDGDDARLRMAPFPAQDLSITSKAMGEKATLGLNAVGSFSVIYFDDKDGDGEFDDGTEPGCFLNLIVVRIQLSSTQTVQSEVLPMQQSAKPSPPGLILVDGVNPTELRRIILIQNGGNSLETVGILLQAEVDIFGGGKDGRRGVDRVVVGWLNNLLRQEIQGTYAGNKLVKGTISDVDLSPPRTDFAVTDDYLKKFPPIKPPLKTANPLLDTSRDNPGTGGATVFLRFSMETEKTDLTPLGQQRRILGPDSPNVMLPLRHPKFTANRLEAIKYELDFQAWLVAFAGSNQAEPSEPGSSLYATVQQVPWNTVANFTLTWPDGGPPNNDPTVTAKAGNTIKLGTIKPHAPAKPLADVKAESCLPSLAQRALIFDATK